MQVCVCARMRASLCDGAQRITKSATMVGLSQMRNTVERTPAYISGANCYG